MSANNELLGINFIDEKARQKALDRFAWAREYDSPLPAGGNIELVTVSYRRELASLAFGLGLTAITENPQSLQSVAAADN